MALTQRQAFKVAFLRRCADEGLTIAETRDLVKRAADALAEKRAQLETILKALLGAGKWGVDTGQSAITSLAPYAIGGAMIAPPALGALGGYTAAKLTGGNDETAADITMQEKVDAYRMAAAKAKTDMQQNHKSNASRRRAFRGLF